MAHRDTPQIWWELICGSCYWIIWKARCTLAIEEIDTSVRALIKKSGIDFASICSSNEIRLKLKWLPVGSIMLEQRLCSLPDLATIV